MSTQKMIATGIIIPVGDDYLTDDGRMIRRVYTGRRHNTVKWVVDGIDYLYRSIWEAYHNCKY